MIRIASSEYNPNAWALEIYVSGCTRHCKGCHNEELQDYSRGVPWQEWLERNRKKLTSPLVKRLWILGGDVLCQDMPSYHGMMRAFKDLGLEMWLWTGCEYESIPESYHVWDYFYAVKAGPYELSNTRSSSYRLESSLGELSLKLAGDNQGIYICGKRQIPVENP